MIDDRADDGCTSDERHYAHVATQSADIYLPRGFTAVRDPGGNTFSLKKAIDKGLVADDVERIGARPGPPAHGDLDLRGAPAQALADSLLHFWHTVSNHHVAVLHEQVVLPAEELGLLRIRAIVSMTR